MLVERDNPGRDALILAGPCLVWDEALDDEHSARLQRPARHCGSSRSGESG
jgi:hypothetical protein